ncbi:MAG: transketolase C-terminal domain-containing protein [Candidatus Nanopelagicales bacterium]
MRDTFAAELLAAARLDPRIMFLTGDLGFGVFETLAKELPEQYLNVGIAEQNMVAVATGLALEGNIVFTYSIGNFPVLRCLEQIRNDAAYHAANVKVVSVGGGFSYGPLGMSHHATEDIAIMRAIPEIESFIPGTKGEVSTALKQIIDHQGTCYLRLDKSVGTDNDTELEIHPGPWNALRNGADITLVGCGGIVGELQEAAVSLEAQGISARVVSAVRVPVEAEDVVSALGTPPIVITVEEHVISGGIGGLVAEAIADLGVQKRLIRLGIRGVFVSEVGSQRYLRRQIGIDGPSLVKVASAALA